MSDHRIIEDGRVLADRALAVPVEPAGSLAASRFDPSRVNFSEMAAVLGHITPMRQNHWTAFTSRLKNFQRLGLGPKSGRGKAQYFDADEALTFALCFQMACVGIMPEKIVADINANIGDILTHIRRDDARDMMLIYCAPPLYSLTVTEGPERVKIVSRGEAPHVGDLNRAIIINLSALVAAFRMAWDDVLSTRESYACHPLARERASAIETRSAETQSGSVRQDESAAAKPDAQPSTPSNGEPA